MGIVPIKHAWLLALLVLLSVPAPARAGEGVLTAQAAVDRALAENPGLAAARERAAALGEVPARMGTLPDPSLRLGLINLPVDTFSTAQENMTQLQVGVRQMLPFPGKLALRERAAAQEAEAARADSDEARQALAGTVSAAWWRLFQTDRAIGIARANQDLLREFVAVARTKYEVGSGLQQDVLLAELELSKLHDMILGLDGRRVAQAAALNALMGAPAEEPVRLPEEVSDALPALPPVAVLAALAERRRPALVAEARKVDAAASRLRLAEKAHQPDFMVTAAYGFRQGTNPSGSDRADFATLMVAFDLPVHIESRQRREAAEKRRLMARRAAVRADLRNRVAAEVAGLRAEYEQARARTRLFKEGIIPQASQTVASMLAGYRANKVDFLNLVRSQLTLYGYEIQYWDALATARSALARLTAAVGGELPVPGPETGES